MVMNFPPEARSAWVELSSRTTWWPAANLNGTASATRTGRAAARTSAAEASVAEMWSFQPCSGDRTPVGVAKAQGPSTENDHSAPEAARRARAETERSSRTGRSRGATSMDSLDRFLRGNPGGSPASSPVAHRPVARRCAETPRRAQSFCGFPPDSCPNRPELVAPGLSIEVDRRVPHQLLPPVGGVDLADGARLRPHHQRLRVGAVAPEADTPEELAVG